MYGGHEIYRGQLQELHAGVCGGDVQYESQLSFRHAEEKHGVSFKEMIQHYRFIYVTTMLKNTAQPVDQIILWAGYENTTYFYKKFREQYGCTPKQYRKEHQSVKTS